MQKTVAAYAEKQKRNCSGFVVIGAGLPRTGTLSTRAALGQLLDGACYHMFDVASGSNVESDFWNKAMEGKIPSNSKDWIDFLQKRGYRAGVDYPISLFYRELMEAYPDAKVVLTTRTPETWYQSVKNSIYRTRGITNDPAVRLFLWIVGQKYIFDTVQRISVHDSCGMGMGMFDVIEKGPKASEDFYNRWVEEVKRYVPKDRLLVFSVKEGWAPLCKFLDLPIPDGPFPRVNDTKQMQEMANQLKRMASTVVYGGGVALAAILVGTYYWMSVAT